MSREIKFRAWDGEKILYPLAPRYVAIGGCSWGFWDDGKLLAVNYRQNHELMQYTGRKDSDNVEIYEGDIVEWENPDLFGEPENGAIRIGNKVRSVIEYDDKEGCFKPLYWYDCNLENDDLRVIGNIYQNPELVRHG